MGLANSGARIRSEPTMSSALLLNDSVLVFFNAVDDFETEIFCQAPKKINLS